MHTQPRTTRGLRRITALITALTILTGTAHAEAITIKTVDDSDYTHYRVTASVKRCSVEWRAATVTSPEYGRVSVSSNCRLGWQKVVPLHRAALREVLKRSPAFPVLHSIEWGVIADNRSPDKTPVVRLAYATKKSPLWNSKAGKSRKGSNEKTLARFANDFDIFAELRQALAESGYRLTVETITKVKFSQVRRTKVARRLRKLGMSSRLQVPSRMQIKFVVGKFHGS